MSDTAAPSPKPHLRAALIVLGVLGVLLAISIPVFGWTVQRRLLEMIETPLPMKNQGEWLQRLAFEQKDVLPIYGSSEMTEVVRARPDEFFHSKPTGFRVCPVGSAGNTSFLMAQKVAAIGDAIREKKMAIILSSTWFCRPGVPEDSYAGNFSPLQAGGILLQDELDTGLRGRFEKRLLDFPGTLPTNPPLGSFLRHSESRGTWSAFIRAIVRPLLWASRAELTWEDHFASSSAALNFDNVKPPHAGTKVSVVDFQKLISQIEASEESEPPREHKNKDNEGDAGFLEVMNASREWDDLALLLDTLKFFKVQVLVLSVPLPAWHFDRHAVSGEAMDSLYKRLESTCAERGFPCVHFSDHQWDNGFTLPNTSHFTQKGWLYVDRVLDDFYHDRLSAPGTAQNAH